MAAPGLAADVAFPEIKAQTMEKKILALPQDFAGEYNLLLVSFDRDQQADVDTWTAAMPELMKGHPGLSYYEIPTIAKEFKPIKFAIDRGMRLDIKNPEQRARTILLYTDRGAFDRALNIQDENRIAVLLVDRKGQVLWREEGLYYDIKGNALKAALAKLTAAGKNE